MNEGFVKIIIKNMKNIKIYILKLYSRRKKEVQL